MLLRYTWRTFSSEIILILLALAFCIPAYILMALSLKSTDQIFVEPLKFPTAPSLVNYGAAWHQGGVAGLGHAMFGSLVVTVGGGFGLVLLGSLCAYALARRPSKLGTTLYTLFVLGIVLPFQLAIIPVYVALRHLHLTRHSF